MVELEQMREKYRLQDRITLLGSIKPHDVQSVRTFPTPCVRALMAGIEQRSNISKYIVDRGVWD